MKLRDGGTFFLLIALFVGFIFAENAEADIQVMIASKHSTTAPIEAGRDWTEFNPGLIYTTGQHYAGAYHNSEGSFSLTAGKVWRVSKSVDFSAGVATGYGAAPLLPTFAAHYTKGFTRFSASPYIQSDKQAGIVIAVSLVF